MADANASRNAAAKVSGLEARSSGEPFLVKPYLQLGHTPAAGKVVLVWHAADTDAPWTVETRPAADRPWQAAAKAPTARRVAVPGIDPHRVYHLALTGLEPGKKFDYPGRPRDGGCSSRPGSVPQVGRPEAAVRRLRRLRGQLGRAEGDRPPGVPREAAITRDDHGRYRLRQGPDSRVSQ